MSNPLPYLVRMLLFLAAVAGIAYLLHEDLLRVFLNTPILNSVIVGVLVVGVFFVMRQVIALWPEVRWLRRFQQREPGAPPLDTYSIDLLAPMATMLGERQDSFRLSPTASRALLDGIATRLDERRELSRYMIGLLIFPACSAPSGACWRRSAPSPTRSVACRCPAATLCRCSPS
jgi:hypothetical protein